MKINFNITLLLKKIFIKIYYFLFIGAVIAIIGLGYFYIIAPLQKDVNEGGKVSLDAKTSQLKELTIYIEKMREMSDQFKSYSSEKISTLSSILPREKDIPGLFVQMQEIAKKNNFALNSIDIADAGSSQDGKITPDEGLDERYELNTENAKKDAIPEKKVIEDNSGILELNISFIITGGNYDNFKSFLSDIEKNLRLFDIYDINFGSVKEGPYSINLRTYYLSP